MADFLPTPEQEHAKALFDQGESLAIEARAGAGKTSTLILLAEGTKRRGRYFSFGRAIADDAGRKMPRNVKASTAHQIAWRVVGRQYDARLRNSQRKPSAEIARFLDIDKVACPTGAGTKVLAPGYMAGLTMRALTRFCQSADPEPALHHFPYVDGIDLPRPDGRRGTANNDMLRAYLLDPLKKAWADVQELEGRLPFKHDVYLKIWQLSDPRTAVDFLLVDEAQDLNPVLLDIVHKQMDHAQVVLVGDSAQAIFGFTGAVDALTRLQVANRCALSVSFRFGPEIADVANVPLEWLGADPLVTGTPSIPSEIVTGGRPDVLLCRTNATAVQAALVALGNGLKPHLVGNAASEVIRFATAKLELDDKAWTPHPELACFQSWNEVIAYVEHDEQGGELKLMVDLIESFGADEIIDGLGSTVPERIADVVISTAHAAKGREWDHVKLAPDFPELEDAVGHPEELRLLYVAASRARLRLDVSNVPDLLDTSLPPLLGTW